MYRFVECGKDENGKTCLIGGITRRSLKSMKHLPKVGKIRYIKGYQYVGCYDTCWVGVLVVGAKGSVRFGGFGWGYHGEGPRGTIELLKRLRIVGVDVALLADWPSFNTSDCGEYWRITLNDDDGYSLKVSKPKFTPKRLVGDQQQRITFVAA